jgi:uncharacterized protein
MAGVMLPTDDQILALHERHAPSPEAFASVHTHCRIVWEIARPLLTPDLDADLVRAGCLLHDIGVYRLGADDAYIRHGVLGEELLREQGLPGRLSRICSHHTGVGVSAQDVRRQGLPLPAADYLAESGEERLVMYADKFHSKSSPPTFLTAAASSARLARFGADKVARFARMVALYGEPDVHSLARRHGHGVAG